MHIRDLRDQSDDRSTVTLFLCDYVALAEEIVGPIPRTTGFSEIWGDAITELDRVDPDAWIINLETSITISDEPAPKGINYRMNPANAPCLTAAGIPESEVVFEEAVPHLPVFRKPVPDRE